MAGKTPRKSRAGMERLHAEIEELRLRLEEAEQALEAIRTGQVESLVLEGPNGPRIFSLEGADHSYRVLVEAMNEGAATLGEDGTILYCNARFAEMLDMPLERVMGDSIGLFVPERSRAAFEALSREANGGESRGEVELQGRTGELVPTYLSISAMHEGERRRLCVVAADLRAQKRNEAIVAADRLAGSVLEQAADAIVVCDESGRVVRASASAADLCRTNPLRLPFSEAFPLVPGSSAGSGTPSDLLARALRGEVLRAVPAVLTRADATSADVLVSASRLHDSDGRPVGCVVTIVDVTERKQAETALRQSEEHLRLALEAAQQGTWNHDLTSGRIHWDDRTRELWGVGSDEPITYDTFMAGLHPDDRAATQAAIDAALTPGSSGALGLEYRVIQRTDGRARWVAVRARVTYEHGRPVRLVGTVQDVTQRKEIEHALREADRRKNQFLAVLSHELRNPLAPIRNSLFALDRVVPGGDQARRARAVIERQTEQLTRLVDDLLDVTRITRGKIQLHRRRLELNELVRRTVEDHQSLFEKNEVSLEVAPAEGPVYVDADWSRLAQVVGNLLQNAAKFTGREGRTRVAVTTDGALRKAVIRVTDTGVGMTPRMLSRLFEPFSQADETLDRSQGGLGLGLALVKGLLDLHGGDISAHSAGPGQGAEFVVRLPLATAEAPRPEEARRAAPHRRRRILIIEDNPDAADSLHEALAFGEHEIAVAYDGPQGLEKARTFRPEVVLCDIGLPGMDGYDVARALRNEETLRNTFLVALTGYALPEDLRRAQEAGFQRHLAKPPSVEKLEELLASVPTIGPEAAGVDPGP